MHLGFHQGNLNLPITPGVDFIGKVVKCGVKAKSLYGVDVYDRVAALVQTGGNCKFISEHGNHLVKVPQQVKSEKAAVLVEIYLSAFQMLLMGVKGSDRYELRSLEGKDILVIGGISNVNQAMIELGTVLGAKNVYTTAVQKHFGILKDLGATVLDYSIENWLPAVTGQMDIVVDSFGDDHYHSSWEALNSKGILVCPEVQSLMNRPPGFITSVEKMYVKAKSTLMPRTHKYDLFSYWETHLEESKVRYLFNQMYVNIPSFR